MGKRITFFTAIFVLAAGLLGGCQKACAAPQEDTVLRLEKSTDLILVQILQQVTEAVVKTRRTVRTIGKAEDALTLEGAKDVSELLLVQEYTNWAWGFRYTVTVVDRDGVVKEIDFSEMPELRDGYGIDEEKSEEMIINCMQNDAFPITRVIDPIPDTILQYVNALWKVTLDQEEASGANDLGQVRTYVVVGSGNAREFINIGEYGDWNRTSSDKRVEDLYRLVNSYMRPA